MEASLAAAPPDEIRWTLARTDHADSDDEEAASALLHCMVRDADPTDRGARFSSRAVEIGPGSYPGFHLTSPPGDASPVGVYHAGFIPAEAVEHVAVLDDGSRIVIPPAPTTSASNPNPTRRSRRSHSRCPTTRSQRRPLGTLVGARSGDKGGNANLGVWARNRRVVALAGAYPHHRCPQATAPRDIAPGGAPPRAGQSPRAELRHRGPARRGCRLVHAVRPAGKGSR